MKGRGGGGLLNSQTHGVKIWGFKNTLKTDKEKNHVICFCFYYFFVQTKASDCFVRRRA